jgi:hypothetical protein
MTQYSAGTHKLMPLTALVPGRDIRSPGDPKTGNEQYSPDDVALWMFAELHRVGTLEQEHAVATISRSFGTHFCYINENGNPSIDRKVLRRFKNLYRHGFVWDRWAKLWRRRTDGDAPGLVQG